MRLILLLLQLPLAHNSPKARQIRLEQNRKAARESRRRKKVMIEELQRSVIFFSRANATLMQQNDELTRLLMQAQAHANSANAPATETAIGDTKVAAVLTAVPETTVMQVEAPRPAAPIAAVAAAAQPPSEQEQLLQANTVATQALYESKGFPAAAARAAAHTMNASLPPMQPGATMQAMANFQQACAQAMQAAMQGMAGIPGVNLTQMAAAPAGTNASQSYTDTLTALSMSQHFLIQGMMPPGTVWPGATAMAAQQVVKQEAAAAPVVKMDDVVPAAEATVQAPQV
jgi:bZIP transcription factor